MLLFQRERGEQIQKVGKKKKKQKDRKTKKKSVWKLTTNIFCNLYS